MDKKNENLLKARQQSHSLLNCLSLYDTQKQKTASQDGLIHLWPVVYKVMKPAVILKYNLCNLLSFGCKYRKFLL